MVRNKVGQVTVFIITGIILLAVFISLILIFSEKQKGPTIPKNPGIEAVKNQVEQCLLQTTKEAIFWNSKNGGYFALPELSTHFIYQNGPYYVYHNQCLVLKKEDFERELEKYLDKFLIFCLNFKSFEKQGYNITIIGSSVKTYIKINQKSVVSTATIPLKIKLGTTITELSDFEAELNDNQLYENILGFSELVNSSLENKFCASCLADIGKKRNWEIYFNDLGNQTYRFVVKDNDYLFNSEPYQISFAVNYE